jgi:hypothetical protein
MRITINTEAVWTCFEQTLDHLAASRMAWGER